MASARRRPPTSRYLSSSGTGASKSASAEAHSVIESCSRGSSKSRSIRLKSGLQPAGQLSTTTVRKSSTNAQENATISRHYRHNRRTGEFVGPLLGLLLVLAIGVSAENSNSPRQQQQQQQQQSTDQANYEAGGGGHKRMPRVVPEAASCQLGARTALSLPSAGSEAKLELEQLERLAQNSEHSLVALLPSEGNNSLPAEHQRLFKTICGGWRNDMIGSRVAGSRMAVSQMTAWTLDSKRQALVAKFVYEQPEVGKLTISFEEDAKLVSPPFGPIPKYHSSPIRSNLSGSCKIRFRTYVTMAAHLDLVLHPIRLPLAGQQHQAHEDPLLLYTSKSGLLSDRNLRGEEQVAWQDNEKALPTNLGPSKFMLEFSAMPFPLREGTLPVRSGGFLSGVAIANFSLTSECFGVGIEGSELEQMEDPFWFQQTGLDVAEQPGWWERPIPALLLGLGLAGAFVVGLSLLARFCLCPHPLEAHDRKRLSLWARICYTFCCCKWPRHLLYLSANKGAQPGSRRRVHVANGKLHSELWSTPSNRPVDAGFGRQIRRTHKTGSDPFEQEQESDAEAYLRPLAAVFANLELNENPGYLRAANGVHAPASQPVWPIAMSTAARLSSFAIDRKRLTLTKPLGKGAFGEVYQGLLCQADEQHQDDSRQTNKKIRGTNGNASKLTLDESQLELANYTSIKVAVKTLTDERMSKENFLKEAANMALVSHRNIVKLIGVCFDEQPLYIVMELLAGGNLKNFLIKNRDKASPLSATAAQNNSYYNQQAIASGPFQLAWPPGTGNGTGKSTTPRQTSQTVEQRVQLCMGDLLVFALDIARACDYLQKNQFIHRDLAARNCLLTSSFKAATQIATSANSFNFRPPNNRGSSSSARSFAQGPPSALDVEANHKVDIDAVYLNGFENSAIVAKLADFGMTRGVSYSNDYYRIGHTEMPVRWMPPECLDGVATTKSDVWSFGIFLWELFSMGQQPYQNLYNNQQVIQFIRSRHHVLPSASSLSNALAGETATCSDKNNNLDCSINHPTQPINDGPQRDGARLPAISLADECLSTVCLLKPEVAQYKTAPNGQIEPDNGNNNMAIASSVFQTPDADSPPLPPPHDNTPLPIYSIMCSCWATNPEDRPQFEEIANRLYWCLQMPEVLATSLPQFYEQSTPKGSSFMAMVGTNTTATTTMTTNRLPAASRVSGLTGDQGNEEQQQEHFVWP